MSVLRIFKNLPALWTPVKVLAEAAQMKELQRET